MAVVIVLRTGWFVGLAAPSRAACTMSEGAEADADVDADDSSLRPQDSSARSVRCCNKSSATAYLTVAVEQAMESLTCYLT